MLVIDESAKARLLEAMKFAADHGLVDNLIGRLAYLGEYAYDSQRHSARHPTKCILRWDHAPLSFSFTMMEFDLEATQAAFAADRSAKAADGYDKTIPKTEDDYVYKPWFVGGLIYSGPEAPGDGSAPSFTVSLDDKIGWSVHT